MSLDTKPNVVVVSAFGRGNWLAGEIQSSLNCDVQLVDVSESLGRWAPEDWEGPFGLLQSERTTQTQNARLDEEDYADPVEEGFCVWTKSGPFDLRGTHSPYLLEKRGVSSEVQEYLSCFDTLTEKRKIELKRNIEKLPFQSSWLACLAHSIAGVNYTSNSAAISKNKPLPVFSPYSVRRASRRGVEKSWDWLRAQGVKTYTKAKIQDISILGQQIQGVEIQSDWSGVLRADQLIWSLSGLETKRLGAKFEQMLFSDVVVEPDWVWVRYRFDLGKTELSESLPMKFVVIEDLALPWTHANLQLIQKTSARDNYDIWARIPAMHRFQKQYLENVGQEIIDILKKRLPASEPHILDYPQDYLYDEVVLGPARFYLYNENRLDKIKRKFYKNIHHDSSDLVENLDWTDQFSHQRDVFGFLKSWKLEWDKKIEKQKLKERESV